MSRSFIVGALIGLFLFCLEGGQKTPSTGSFLATILSVWALFWGVLLGALAAGLVSGVNALCSRNQISCFRFSLLELVLLCLVSALFVGQNVREETEIDELTLSMVSHGWPFKNAVVQHKPMNRDSDRETWEFGYAAILLNFLVVTCAWLGMHFLGLTTELHRRRQRSGSLLDAEAVPVVTPRLSPPSPPPPVRDGG
jgi:ABC-type uncharacterized transport system permease subunit